MINVPKLRFPEFSGEWGKFRVNQLLQRTGEAVQPQHGMVYREIGIRSHGKGIFHKEAVTADDLGNKRVFKVHVPAFVVNIVFAWEHAIGLTNENEAGFIASHRFPMFIPKGGKVDLAFTKYFFLRPYGKHLLGLASPGGAGRNKTLGQQDFARLSVVFPEKEEQQKIADFLTSIDTRIQQLTQKKALLEQYKKGIMQKLFSQEIRFRDDGGKDYADWEEKRVKNIAPLQRGFDLPTSNIQKGDCPVVYSNGILRHHSVYKVKGPGVVTGRSGTIGKVNFVEKNYWPHNTSLWVTDFFDNIPKFIFYFYMRLNLDRFNAGSTVPTLNRNDVHSLIIH
jgi:type I restriction enzyme S subunit